jgi:CBS domain-containing protein
MTAHSLAIRTADFLIQHPPYGFLQSDELEEVAAELKLRYLAPGEFLFKEGDAPGTEVYILQKGKIKFLQGHGNDADLVDYCEPGDTMGVRSVITSQPYVFSALAEDDGLVYALPKDLFLPLMERYPKFGLFFATGFAAGMAIAREEKKHLEHTRRELMSGHLGHVLWKEEELIPVKAESDVPFCYARNVAQEAAQILAEFKESAIVVVDDHTHPVGIITNNDLTRKVATGLYNLQTPVEVIMSHPVKIVPPETTVSKALLEMMSHNIRHLVVTEDGTPDTLLKGLITERDIFLSQGNNPGVLVKQLHRSSDVNELMELRHRAASLAEHYLKQEVSMDFVNGMMTEVNDALISRAIELSLDKLGPAPRSFAWLSLGSEGRGEQILRTDQDNALIYEEDPKGDPEAAQAYFLNLGQEVTDILIQCGFAPCPGEIMANNPKWCQPLSGWQANFRSWVETPDPKNLMHTTIFFDFRTSYGDEFLERELQRHLSSIIDPNGRFLPMLAKNALHNPPPLSFFGRFIVEASGEHKDEFDIKARAMMPLVDTARVLMLAYPQEKVAGNTVARYQRLGELEPQNAKLFEEAAMAYEMLLRHRAINGFETQSSGRYLNPQALNKIEKKTLKYVFQTIKRLQSLLKTRFSLGFLG